MISELGPVQAGHPRRPGALATANQAANRPHASELRRLAAEMRKALPPGSHPASPAGLGGSVDIRHSGDSGAAHPDLPFLKPLGDGSLGQNINTVI